jgi:hypothetical protein
MRHRAHEQSLLEILHNLKSKQENFLVIAEDTLHYKGNHPTVRSYVELMLSIPNYSEYKNPPISGILQKLSAQGVEIINAEYRIMRQVGLFIRNVFGGAQTSHTLQLPPITAKQVVSEYDQTAYAVRQYPEIALRDYYQTTLDPIYDFDMRELEPMRLEQCDILQYAQIHVPTDKISDWKRKFMFFDAHLLEAKILHHIMQNLHKNKIFILTGASHMYHIGRILETVLSYQRLAHIGPDQFYEYDQTTRTSVHCLELRDLDIMRADNPTAIIGNSYS